MKSDMQLRALAARLERSSKTIRIPWRIINEFLHMFSCSQDVLGQNSNSRHNSRQVHSFGAGDSSSQLVSFQKCFLLDDWVISALKLTQADVFRTRLISKWRTGHKLKIPLTCAILWAWTKNYLLVLFSWSTSGRAFRLYFSDDLSTRGTQVEM